MDSAYSYSIAQIGQLAIVTFAISHSDLFVLGLSGTHPYSALSLVISSMKRCAASV